MAFTDNRDGTATLEGAPAGGTGGVYRLTIAPANDVGPAATHEFTTPPRGRHQTAEPRPRHVVCRALDTPGGTRPTVVGRGTAEPIADSAGETGRAKNRRVVVTVTHRPRRLP